MSDQKIPPIRDDMATDAEIAQQLSVIERWMGCGSPEDNYDAWGNTPLISRILARLDKAERELAELKSSCAAKVEAAVKPWRTLVGRAVDNRIDNQWLKNARALLAASGAGEERTDG